MDYRRDPRVDDHFAPLPPWQLEVCQRVRELVHEADPEVEETIRRHGAALLRAAGQRGRAVATKHHVNVFTYDGGLAPDPYGIVTGGHGNATGRTIAIYEDRPVDDAALLETFGEIVAINRAGGWRRIRWAPGE